MAKKQKVASWYWNITAILTPFVLIAALVLIYNQNRLDSYEAESARILKQVTDTHRDFQSTVTPQRLHAQMRDVASAIGFRMGGPLDGAQNVQPAEVPRTVRANVVPPEELTATDQGPLLRNYLEADGHFFGDGTSPGYVHEYVAARKWLDELENRVKRYLAFKSEQYYTVRTITVAGEEVGVAEGNLRRTYNLQNGEARIDTAAMNEAWSRVRAGAQPVDPSLQPPVELTLELIFRRQMQLLTDLATVGHFQHNLLYAEVQGPTALRFPDDGTAVAVGRAGETARLASIRQRTADVTRGINDRTSTAQRVIDGLSRDADEMYTDATGRGGQISRVALSQEARIEALADQFEQERIAHQYDASQFASMIRALPRIKTPIRLEMSIKDGDITSSDYSRGVCRINLGSADGVRAGQRFEVWRRHGREQDRLIGVIEVVRTLSANFSLCTVLTLVDESDPVRRHDTIVSRIWNEGRFVTVALHGDFEPPDQMYSKERLAKLLEQAGCRVVDRVQPGVDIVVTGSNLFGDQWYREARRDLRFDTIREDEIRLYVDPR
jgi:hypothetical protein